ncbi:MAG: adenylyltransferase/cytidyltransferase family protein [Bacteriovoracaceae bacterium]|jgi:rfaE bifunctional protein kinase chain/domain|nr:adenylyltransferase/cytidyltransferase family protein [Bacteriovoracaceae bacterium]
MVNDSLKLLNTSALKEKIECLRNESKSVVLCFGHFNVIHPGHMRYLNFAANLGDYLLVAVEHFEPESEASKAYFDQAERAQSVATLGMVDGVFALEGAIEEFIPNVGPNFYVKGKEFEDKRDLIRGEIEAAESCGAKVIFCSGEVKYTSTQFLYEKEDTRKERKVENFLKVCERQDISLEKITNCIESFKNQKILVIGDTIVDQFVACDSLGVSSEAPVQVIRELNAREFVGGAAIVALHVKELGAECSFFSVIGDDPAGDFVSRKLAESGVNTFLYKDEGRPTTFKIRYMVENQKILRVSRLKQHKIAKELEDTILENLESEIKRVDGVIISDFVYGLITQKVLDGIIQIAHKNGVKVFADVQASSQIGHVSKFKGVSLITPTEKEARLALADETSGLEELAQTLIQKTGNENLVITLGEQGLLVYRPSDDRQAPYESEYFGSLSTHAIDVAGAGDALLSCMSLGLCAGLSVTESAALGTCMSAISVERVGNNPIGPSDLTSYVTNLKNHHLRGLSVY